jgi:hypothetical protein
MSQESDQQVDRRGFLKAALATAVATTTVGVGAAAMRLNATQPTIISTTGPTAPVMAAVQLPPATTPESELFTRLASSQAENMRLQAALDAANRQLAAVQQSNGSTQAAQEAVQIELAQANQQVSVLAGLVALYEQLDAVNVEGALDAGLTAVSEGLTNLFAEIPTLEASMAAGQLALAEVEAHLPVLANGQAWLENHRQKLAGYFQSIELILAEVAENAGPFLQMVNDWFANLRKWLPFGLGETAANVMQSITTLLLEIPGTVSGLETNVSQPLQVWLAPDAQNEIALSKNMIKPLRDEVLVKTGETLSKARTMEAVYQEQLRIPTQTAVASRTVLHNLIAEYRQQNQV